MTDLEVTPRSDKGPVDTGKKRRLVEGNEQSDTEEARKIWKAGQMVGLKAVNEEAVIEELASFSATHFKLLMYYYRLVSVASGKLLQYEVGGPWVSVQTAYGIEVEVENNLYDPSLMVFMDYRDYALQEVPCLEAQYPTFLYAMLMSSTRVFFEETCLASKNAKPFDLLKKKLMSRLETMGTRILKVYEEEWSYIPVGGSLPNTEQKNLAFGAARSCCFQLLDHSKGMLNGERNNRNISMQAWNTLWPQERKRQRAFFLFGLALILQLDIEGIRTFFHTFFRLPSWMWQGFVGSSLSSVDLVLFAFYMFVMAPNDMRMSLVRHLLSDPTGATMIRTYLTI
ncbi:hypothetical protein REPUB_Repub18cG0112400 [Reevesia pubescens]